ncbi:LysR substrate-binding domain-containing protein [Streptomyces thinghirensis]|nr:LysR substrate-binding domain-containing protein [Streptomyces thinghirensis]
MAFVGADIRDPHLRVRAVKRYHVQLLVPAGHPLALRKSVRLRDVAGEPFVDMPIGFGQRQIVDDAFTRAELSRRVLIEVSDITTIAGTWRTVWAWRCCPRTSRRRPGTRCVRSLSGTHLCPGRSAWSPRRRARRHGRCTPSRPHPAPHPARPRVLGRRTRPRTNHCAGSAGLARTGRLLRTENGGRRS